MEGSLNHSTCLQNVGKEDQSPRSGERKETTRLEARGNIAEVEDAECFFLNGNIVEINYWLLVLFIIIILF